MGIHWPSVTESIRFATGSDFTLSEQWGVGGGSINESFILSDQQTKYFVKFNRASLLDMFEAESDGLQEIRQSGTIRVPEVICHGIAGNQSFLVQEYLDLGAKTTKSSLLDLGRSLAAMHRVQAAEFGWFRSNTIGATPQINDFSDNWVSFWTHRRLGFQLDLLEQNGFGSKVAQNLGLLLSKLDQLFINYDPRPALLHGDLWSGNYGVTSEGEAVIFDPAVYYGDREADIAMTELFGGFPSEFYSAYNEVYPLNEGYAVRKTLYNLYHILNHVNLFGASYLGQAQSMIERLLSELRG